MFISKINDNCQGYCFACKCPMSGRIVTGANTVLTEKLPTSHMNSIVQGNCGHIGYLITSSKNIVEKLPFGQILNFFQGTFTGHVTTGSTNTWSL